MSTELSNGVIIPEEYSDDWYDEMSINLRKLNDVITAASDNATDIQRLDTDKANQSDLTALQTAVSTAQATANSAQQTATTARQQSYVFRYSGTAVVPNSTITYSTIDNTDNIKAGDKILDVDGKLFEITAVDTANQTVTVGSALIDLALDANVVHTSGNETVGGQKTFSDTATFGSVNVEDIRWKSLVNQTVDLNDCYVPRAGAISGYYTTDISSGANISNKAVNTAFTMLSLTTRCVSASDYQVRQVFYGSGAKYIRTCSDGTWTAWVNETDKYVTIDTAQTILGNKVWIGTNTFQQNVTYQRTNFYHQVANPSYILKDTELEKGSLATTHASYPGLWLDKNSAILGYMRFVEYSSGRQTVEFRISNLIKNGALDPTGSEVNCAVDLELQPSGEKSLIPEQNNDINLGTSANKWKSFNGLTPSSLSLPTDNASNIIDISGYITVLDGSSANTYQAPDNGYISIIMNNCTGIQAYITGFWGNQIVRPTAGAVRFFMPICKNMTANILVFGGTVDNARFFPCQGNI